MHRAGGRLRHIDEKVDLTVGIKAAARAGIDARRRGQPVPDFRAAGRINTLPPERGADAAENGGAGFAGHGAPPPPFGRQRIGRGRCHLRCGQIPDRRPSPSASGTLLRRPLRLPSATARGRRGRSPSHRAWPPPRSPKRQARSGPRAGHAALKLLAAVGAHHSGQRMRMGQTASHLPQKVDALGRCPASCTPIRSGSAPPPWARVNPAIGVPADRAVDRTVVHAGRTPDTAEHVLEFPAEHLAPPVVQQDDVVFLRTMRVALPPGAGGQRV